MVVTVVVVVVDEGGDPWPMVVLRDGQQANMTIVSFLDMQTAGYTHP